MLEGTEKLNYLTSRLGDEIAQLPGKRAGFAPHWAAPDRIAHALRRDVPLWVISSVFALLAVLAFMGLRWTLERQTHADLGMYSQLVKLAPAAGGCRVAARQALLDPVLHPRVYAVLLRQPAQR